MFLKAIKYTIDDGTFCSKSLKTTPNASHKKFLENYLALDDQSIYQTILEQKSSRAAEIIHSINHRKLLKRACEYELSTGNNQKANKEILKLDTDKFTKELVAMTKIPDSEIIVMSLKITIKLYDRGDILVLHKGVPLDLNDLSPISSQNHVNKLFVFGPRDKKARKKLTKAVSDLLTISARDITPFE